MSKPSGIHYLHEHSTPGMKTSLPTEVQKIQDTVTAGLSDLLQGAFDAVDDSLFELANNSRSNNEQNRYFEAMREVRIKRKGVEKRFRQALINLFEQPPSDLQVAAPRTEQATADTLSLVQNDDLEEQVAFNAMVTKARAHFQGTLLQLQTRFSSIYPSASEEHPVNPLSPELLCSAFRESIDDLDVQIRERLILIKQFDRYVVSNLGMVLEEANRILVQAGVMPNFRFRGKASESKPGQTNTDAGQTTAPRGSEEGLFEQIREMLSAQRANQGQPPRSADPHLHIIGGAELYQALSMLPQPTTTTQDLSRGEPTVLDLRQVVLQLLQSQQRSDGKEPALNEVDEDLINLVSMLFEFILDDYNLSPPIQVLISRLQIPILKVVIKDKAFFSKATHPARKLLNALARAGIGWSDSDEKNRDKLYEQIHNIVLQILNEFDGDIGLFERLYDEFDHFLARENRKATLVEQRTREAERGRIKSQKAQETVDQLLRDRIARCKVPETVRNIIMNGWSRVMFLAYLRDDTEHRWSQSVRVVDDLLWCLQPHLDEEEREQWVRLVPVLLKTLRSGLEEVSYNAARLDEMMGDLKRELTEAFKRHAMAEAREESPVAQTNETEEPLAAAKTAVERQQELEDAAVAEFITRIDAIGVGTWVEFNLVNGARFRCKLSAIIDEADCFVFVNRMGLKVIEKTRLDLAHEMRRGRLTVLEQGALIDRALDAVVGSLRRKAS
ncbi:DUF1631 domain-containing protein [Mangrovitalea sediminis]|uniref:DUF1631 domain-containing protein n=1 Tax=Mangrovitalea sediminis TaxID=1982043 RepID=UPI000BE609D0|nr:DUF1631 domain-containing protein [Mangrovitalea sediminis]